MESLHKYPHKEIFQPAHHEPVRSRSPESKPYQTVANSEENELLSSYDNGSQVRIIVVDNKNDSKLPDIRFRVGHSVEFNPSLNAAVESENTMKNQQDSKTLMHYIENIPDNDDAYRYEDKQKHERALKRNKAFRYNKQETQSRRPVVQKNDAKENGKEIGRPLAPIDNAAKKRWVATTRPLSHSEDRKLFVFAMEADSMSLFTAKSNKDDEHIHTTSLIPERKISKQDINTKKKLLRFVDTDSVGYGTSITTLFGKVKVTYLDYTASGRPLKCIESYIRKHVMPTYANTHTTVSHTGMQTTLFREEARDIIRRSVNAGRDDRVIFTGSGVTTAINKLVHTLNIGPDREEDVFVYVGPYEHHSNILPWMSTKATVTRVRQNAEGLTDVPCLAKHLEAVYNDPQRHKKPLIIGSFSAASNVTGILSNVDEISALIHRYDGYVIWDYACAGPYIRVDMNPPSEGPDKKCHKDAVVISPHKFIGGPGTPGLLIAKKWMFQNPVPHNVGGGTVLFVRREHHVYVDNPEHSEEGGTPAILESIRAGLVFKLKDAITPEYIMKREEMVLKKAVIYLREVPGLVLLGNTRVHRLPILSFMFYHEKLGRFLHHDFMAMLFNDVFGIQVRSGCACAAPYGLDLLGMSEELAVKYESFIANTAPGPAKGNTQLYKNVIYKPGFVRFSLPYFITPECLDFVLAAIHMTTLHGWAMLPQYTYDRLTGQWSPRFKKARTALSVNHLSDVDFKSGSMKVTLPSQEDKDSSDSMSDSSFSSNKSMADYEAILYKAESLFRDALAGAYDCPEETEEEKGDKVEEHEEELRWFVKPVEAANLIHGRQATPLDPDDLPFMPGALASKIKYDPKGHRGRNEAMDRDFVMEYHPDR